MKQTPSPGERLILLRGDTITFTLDLHEVIPGQAYLRTNLGRAAVKRNEIVANTERNKPILHTDWHDLPMRKISETEFRLVLPLVEVGSFEAKAWFQPDDGSKNLWVEGEHNTRIKVEPADTVCSNTIYTLFTRQFGKNKCENSVTKDIEKASKLLDTKDYSVIPSSGTFREVIKELDFIIGTLRSRIIQLLPVHPVPTTYARMGRYGSPFASLDFFSVDPAYAEFDTHATPLEQFQELIDEIHARDARVFIDVPVNHTGWASQVQMEHPEWFERKADGEFISPGAWGVVWADLCQLDYENEQVHALMAKVFLYWCRRGIDGFRCDAGYMLPYKAWKYITAKVRNEYPDTVFLLEGLGGPLEVTDKLLGKAGLNWAYSELFQNYDRSQISSYLPSAITTSMKNGVHVHFAETHDNNRLAATSHEYAQLRTALCAMFSHNGAFGITNGVEWFAESKVDVHGASPLNWDNPDNQIHIIRRLYAIMEVCPSFWANSKLELIQNGSGNVLAMLRTVPDTGRQNIVLANLELKKTEKLEWSVDRYNTGSNLIFDLVSGKQIPITCNAKHCSCELPPATVVCLTEDVSEMQAVENALESEKIPERIMRQRRRAVVLDVINDYQGCGDVSNLDIDKLADILISDPMAVCSEIFGTEMPPVATWVDGLDQNRMVMVPAGDMLLFQSEYPFRVEIRSGTHTVRTAQSMKAEGDGYFALVASVRMATECKLDFCSFREDGIIHSQGDILFMHKENYQDIRFAFSAKEIKQNDRYALCTNNLGGMSQVHAAWGEIRSKYDAVLAANLSPDFPVDRTVMFSRCRAWMVYKDFSQELNLSCLDRFTAGLDNRARWLFSVPVGQGKTVDFAITLKLLDDANFVCLHFERKPSENGAETALKNSEKVKLILRPDIEDRCNHEVTKAFTGPENRYREATSYEFDGFRFNPSLHHTLIMKINDGKFITEPEWHYIVDLPVENNRGLESHTDLYSPGYFEFMLGGGESRCVSAEVSMGHAPHKPAEYCCGIEADIPETVPVEEAMRKAIAKFIVKRDNSHTVIAGYPWFLDWGRDTLICLRGMIAAGYMDESRDIINVFAGFERNGSLPNMIRGNDDSNRDTSDAPLWMFAAVRDYITAVGNAEIMDMECQGRKLLDVLKSIVENYIKGTPNGIKMDNSSGLIFSPSHYTWMDTNHPAGTPREGYPVEIQALWFSALKLLGEYDPMGSRWKELSRKVSESLIKYYRLPDGSLSDCLHTASGGSAAAAVQDDACRSNQLFAVTLGAITDRETIIKIINACEQLIIPGGIRSLADRPVKYKLPVYRDEVLLNDPQHPFWGRYEGDEDTRRKPAYHNGTAWSWPFPSFCEALAILDEKDVTERAFALLMSAGKVLETGCPGQMPEIYDGATPHQWRGCGAQAWGITELYRVYNLLNTSLT